MTTAHNTLTGTDLHESKGASTATAGQVAIANGSGNAVFGTIGPSSLSAAANPFGAQLFHVREEQNASTASATTVTNNAWTTCVLNTTKTNEVSGSLASNQITLPAGTYYVSAYSLRDVSNSGSGYFSKIRLRNVTSSADLIYGPSQCMSGSGQALQFCNPLSGRFTLAGTTIIELQYIAISAAGNQIPIASTSSVKEVWSDVQIWKIA